MKKYLLFCLVVFIFFSEINKAIAANTFDWIGTTSVAWGTPSNWKLNGGTNTTLVPGGSSSDIVNIGNGTSYSSNQPTLGSATTIASLNLGSTTAPTLTLSAALTVSGAITINGTTSFTGGSALTGGSLSITSTITLTLNTNVNITGAATLSNSPTISIGSGYTLAVTGTMTSKTNGATITITGAGSATLGGYTFAYQSNFTIGSSSVPSTTVTITSGTVAMTGGDNTTSNTFINYGTFTLNSTAFNIGTSMPANETFTNYGTVNLNSGSSLLSYGNNFTLTNTGTFNVSSATITYQSSSGGSSLNNTYPGTFIATSSTINLQSGTSSTITNTGSFTATLCTIMFGTGNSSNPVEYLKNNGTGVFTAIGCTFTTAASPLSASAANCITNSGTMTLQAYNNPSTSTTITLGNYLGINNSGILNAGISNSPCSITLSGTSSNITNTGTFNLGSTSIITPSGATSKVTNTSPGVFTLESDAYGSATIGASNTGGSPSSVTGIYNVQRYINGGSSSGLLNYGRGYRLLSSPVNLTSTTGGGNISLAYIHTAQSVTNPNAVAGTVTYNGALTAGPAGGGFDITGCCSNPTIYLYDEAIPSNTTSLFTGGKTPGVTAITSNGVSVQFGSSTPVSATIPVGNAYYLYYIGDNSSLSYSASRIPNATTITATGFINQQTIPVTLWNTSPTAGTVTPSTKLSLQSTGTSAGWNMVGNPYPSAIDLSVLVTDNKAISSSNTYVSFAALDDYTDQFDTYNATSGMSSNSNFFHYIASGQGFMVLATANNAQTLTFKEDQKVTNATAPLNNFSMPPILLAKKIPTSALPADNENPVQARSLNTTRSIITSPSGAVMHLKLIKDSVNNDACAIGFAKQWPDKFGTEDVIDLDGNPNIYLSSYSSDGVRTSINAMGDYTQGKRVKLYVKGTSNGLYKLMLNDIANLDTTAFNIYLVDNLKNDSLDMARYKTYNFNLTASDTASYHNRFVLAIEKKQLPPYQLVSFAGQKVTKGVQLNWKVNNEGDYTGFVLQKQDAGGNFNQLYSQQSNDTPNYSYTDVSPVTGNNIYRLQQNDINGNITYSNTVTILYNPATGAETFSVYPNPAKDLISISINSASSATINYNSNIYNAAGTIVAKRSVSSNTWTEDVSSYKAGVYIIELSDNEGNLIGKSKFVKTN